MLASNGELGRGVRVWKERYCGTAASAVRGRASEKGAASALVAPAGTDGRAARHSLSRSQPGQPAQFHPSADFLSLVTLRIALLVSRFSLLLLPFWHFIDLLE